MTRIPLIAGNWKMNLDHLQAIALVQKLSWSLKDVKHDYAETEVAVFPPFTDLRSVQTLLAADRLPLALGAQDLSQYQSGAYTGEISASFLKKLDVSYVLVGHSERRNNHQETDEVIAHKMEAAVSVGITPVLCVGESAAHREAGESLVVPLAQLEQAIVRLHETTDFVIAYEPVWAIGTGTAATPEDAESVCAALRQKLAQLRGDAFADATRILYGGSVSSQNVANFIRQPNVDGALVGGASIDAKEFSNIVQFKKHLTVG